MYTLAIDTCSQHGSLALFRDRAMITDVSWARQESHSELITSQTEQLLSKNRISLREIHRLAVNIGPGSFTGIRVGVNFARTLAYCLNVPVYTINSLELLAQQLLLSPFKMTSLPVNTEVRSVIYAFRDLVYTASYKLNQRRVSLDELSSPQCLTYTQCLSEIHGSTLVLGSGALALLKAAHTAQKYVSHIPTEIRDYSLASDFATTPALDQSAPHLSSWIHTIPLYIRASEAEEKLRSGQLKPVF